jgi:raffinose/stachyose/melibiose transport system substrate-binding protein/xylobiose transport system substrate-binding protein
VAAVLSLGAAACGTGGPGESGAKRVTVWSLQDTALNPVQQKEISAYNTAGGHPKVELQTFANDPYKQKLQTALGSPNAPDVFSNWGGGNLRTYVKAGNVVDISGLLRSTPGFRKAFLPSVLDGARLDGKYYGVPLQGMQPVSIYYNKRVFAKAGIAAPPASWDDLLADAGRLKSAGVTPFALAGSQSWTELMWMEYLLDRVGGPAAFTAIQDGKPGAWRDPAVARALNMIVDLVDRGAFGTKYGSVGQDNGAADALLSQGKAAMELMGSWEYSAQLTAAPAFVNGGGLGWAAFPTVPGGKGDPKDVVGNPSNFFSVTTKSKNRQAAQAFLTKTITDPAYVDALIKIGQVPPLVGVEPKLKAAPHADFTTYIYDTVKATPSFQQSWDQALDPATSQKLLTNLQKVFAKQQTPKQFVEAMAG